MGLFLFEYSFRINRVNPIDDCEYDEVKLTVVGEFVFAAHDFTSGPAEHLRRSEICQAIQDVTLIAILTNPAVFFTLNFCNRLLR